MNSNYPSGKQTYSFDGFTVDTEDFVVKKDGSTLTLTPRAFDVLALLLGNRGHLVEKRQLFDEVWKESFVSDNALTKVIKELRHALNDSAEDPKYIETIPKRGYRFIAPVEVITRSKDEEPESNRAVEFGIASIKGRAIAIASVILVAVAAVAWFGFKDPDGGQSRSTIAVLPFKPLDAESRNESLEFGMAESLVTRLNNLRRIVVRPIASTRKYSDLNQDPIKAGEELQTSAVLDGSIQKAGDRVRVTVRLLDVRSRATLWSEQFDENFTDIFRVQDSIALRIATVLAVKLSRDEQERLAKHMTESPEAYEAYLQGQFYRHRREALSKGLDAFSRATDKDPNFALAHIGVAETYISLNGHRQISWQDAAAKAEPRIRKALEIDNDLAEAHNALAELKYQYQYDWRGAEAEFKTALELNPNVAWIHQAYGWFLMSEGRFDEADHEMERAHQLDPSSITLDMARGRLYYYSRQYDRAIRHFHTWMELEPNDIAPYLGLINAYDRKGMHRECVEIFLKGGVMRSNTPEKEKEIRDAFESGGAEGFYRKLLAGLDESYSRAGKPPATTYVSIYARLEDKEKTLYWMEKAFDDHDVAILQYKIEPVFDFLRDDPRFAELLSRIGQTP